MVRAWPRSHKDLPEALRPLVEALDGRPDRAERLVALAAVMRNEKKPGWARLLIRMALEPESDNPAVLGVLRHFWDLPAWHFRVLTDVSRADAYERAIQDTLRPTDLVLEIGTGSGLLALLAARAGAEQVITCERDPYLADCAREIIRLNGYADRIQVISGSSLDLRVGRDLPRLADVLLADLFTENLYRGGGLPLFQDAQARLLGEGARLIPATAGVHLSLVSAPALAQRYRVDQVSGFDLGPFNRFLPPSVPIPSAEWDLAQPRLLSDPVEAFRIDFSQLSNFKRSRRRLDLTASVSGCVDGVVWWLSLGLSDTVSLDGAPGNPATRWPRHYHSFSRSWPLAAGRSVTVMADQDLHGCRVWQQP